MKERNWSNTMKFILTLSLSLLLAACTSISLTPSDPGLNTLHTGSILTLHQSLTIPALKVRTSIQDGVETVNVDPSEPYCEFEVNTILETSTTLPAGDYRVTRVLQYEFPFSSKKSKSINMVASSSETTAWNTLASASPDSIWHYTTAFRLVSKLHADIRQLECGTVFDSGYFAHHITIKQFEKVAGDIMSLRSEEK
jgi:hypothetical protein